MKLLEKARVLTNGSGQVRVVLDYESGLCYAYHNPEKITAIYESGAWHVTQCPRYSSGGWGRSSTGDWTGYHFYENTVQLLRSIGAQVFAWNIPEFFTQDEFKMYLKRNSDIEKVERLSQKLGVKREFNTDWKKLEKSVVSSQYFDGMHKFHKKNPRGIDVFKILEAYKIATQVFLKAKGPKTKCGDYVISSNLVTQGDITVAFRDTKGDVFMNSQVLRLATFEKNFLGSQSPLQIAIREIAKYSIPFNVLDAAGLKLSETKVLEQGPESTHTVLGVERHFTGALLLENSKRKFLMDIDRVEIEHGIFNAFFVEVDKSVKSISEAYDSMKPQSVKDAEKRGVEVKRQGEWFFIETDKEITVKRDAVNYWVPSIDTSNGPKKYLVRSNVSHGKGRPNSLLKPVGFGKEIDELVCGIVRHSGREHRDLNLGVENAKGDKVEREDQFFNGFSGEKDTTFTFKLWQLAPNTTVSNFTIQGDVD